MFFISCLIELKSCEVSQNSISNWTWKCQLSILKNKKSFIPKEIHIIKTKKLCLLTQFSGKVLGLTSLTARNYWCIYHKLQYLFLSNSSLRWDALKAHQHNLTAFAYLRKHGVSIPSVTPVFPPEDYPVWTSMATGRIN